MKKRLLALLLVLALMLPLGALAASSSNVYYRVNTSWLRAREEPSWNGRVLDSYRRDYAVSVLKNYKGGWSKVVFWPKGRVAYVQNQYLKASSSYTAYVAMGRTLLRPGPGKNFKTGTTLNLGEKVTVLTHGKDWDYVFTGKGDGYIMNTLLTTKKPTGSTIYVCNPAGRTVNLRRGPGKNFKVMAEFRPGTKGKLLEVGEIWSRVTINGKTGYMMSQYLSIE